MDRRRAASASPFEGRYGFSRAIRVGERIIVAGTAPIWPDGSVDPDPAAQMRRCCEIAIEALEDLGATAADVVRTRIFVTDSAIQDAVGAIHGEFFGVARPAATMVVVARLLDPSWVVEIEVEAQVDG
jgi:enamine deaminase RidA (YjgF/YER057c/UK114 family)